MKNIFIVLVIVLTLEKSYCASFVNKGENETSIKGEYIYYIYLAFHDYKIDKKHPFNEIKYYEFDIQNNKNEIIIEISYDLEFLKKYLGHYRKGGGGKYTFDKNNQKIKNKILYK